MNQYQLEMQNQVTGEVTQNFVFQAQNDEEAVNDAKLYVMEYTKEFYKHSQIYFMRKFKVREICPIGQNSNLGPILDSGYVALNQHGNWTFYR